jgi:hypothetical protein
MSSSMGDGRPRPSDYREEGGNSPHRRRARTPVSHSDREPDRNSLMNTSFERSVSERWRQAALSGNLALAWSISDEFLRSKIDCSRLERWRLPLWDGSPIDGRNVLIQCWRGLGDAIHFIR